MARFQLDRTQTRRAAQEAATAEVRTGSRIVANRAKVLVPVDTGRLRSSVRNTVSSSGDPVGTISTNVEYAPHVEFGTRPHKIRAKNGGALKFRWHGRTVYLKSVNHPGTQAKSFLRRALREVSRARGWDYREGGID